MAHPCHDRPFPWLWDSSPSFSQDAKHLPKADQGGLWEVRDSAVGLTEEPRHHPDPALGAHRMLTSEWDSDREQGHWDSQAEDGTYPEFTAALPIAASSGNHIPQAAPGDASTTSKGTAKLA